jgi:glycosyltransferase involved in cell wall biosynthesis
MKMAAQKIGPVPAVTVVIPTYNRASWVAEAVGSARDNSQSLLIEVVVVDDGSTDDTRTALATISGPVRYKYQANAGLAKARNVGLRIARGRYICFLDSDDLLLKGKLANQVSLLEEAPDHDAVYSRWNYIDESGSLLVGEDGFDFSSSLFESLSVSNFAPIHSYLFRRSALLKAGGFCEDLTGFGYEDWDLLLRLAGSGSRFGFTPEVTVSYRMHVASMSIAGAEEMYRCGLDVVARLEAREVSKRVTRETLSLARGQVCLEVSSQLYRGGREDVARSYFRQAVGFCPSLLSHPILFNYLIAYLSPPELGHAAFAVNSMLPAERVVAFYRRILREWAEPRESSGPSMDEALSRLTDWLRRRDPTCAS